MSDKRITLAQALNLKNTIIGENKTLLKIIKSVNKIKENTVVPEDREIGQFIEKFKNNTNKLITLKKLINKTNFDTGVTDLITEKSELASMINTFESTLMSDSYRYSREEDKDSQMDDIAVMIMVSELQVKCNEIQNEINLLNGKSYITLPENFN